MRRRTPRATLFPYTRLFRSAALGTSFALRYVTSLAARQLAKLVPGFGQLAGGAFAVTVSYASTYALGRAACSYLYHKKTTTVIGDGALQ